MPPQVLSCLMVKIAVQGFDTTMKSRSVMLFAERLEYRIEITS
jgi:hypothetical protein